MYTKIIVGYDGSPEAEDALALGRLLARATGASLTAANVVSSDPHWGAADEVDMPDGAEAQLVSSTSPARGLHWLAEEAEADLVIVGSAGHGKAGQILAGNVALRLLNGSPCSVAVAPRGYAEQTPERISQLTIGYDGSLEARAALEEALDLASAAGASVEIVAVARPVPVAHGKAAAPTPGRVADEAVHQGMREHLEEALHTASGNGRVDATLVDGDPAASLAEVATEDGCLLVVGSRGYGPLRRVLLGSVSSELVRTAQCPVIVHPRA